MAMDKLSDAAYFFIMPGCFGVSYPKKIYFMMRQFTIYIQYGLWLGVLFALLILSSCKTDADIKPENEDDTTVMDTASYIFSAPGAKVKRISIETRSGDNVDFIRRDSKWVNKNNLAMNAHYAQAMVKVLDGASFTRVKPSHAENARIALQQRNLRVKVDWINGSQKTFYLATSFSNPPKTFVCFSRDTTMKGPLYEAWINQENKGVTQTFRILLIQVTQNLAQNPCATGPFYLWITHLNKLNLSMWCFMMLMECRVIRVMYWIGKAKN